MEKNLIDYQSAQNNLSSTQFLQFTPRVFFMVGFSPYYLLPQERLVKICMPDILFHIVERA